MLAEVRGAPASAVDEEVAEGADSAHAGCRVSRKARSMSASEERIAAGGHCASSALSRPGFTTKGEGELAERCIQSGRSLCGGCDECGQTFGEGVDETSQ